ncbi:MAG: NAD(P)/FAD-dependent oxidoreductase [Clostridia bacterium]|nr:NAD(P)/FAD-dependent oxidoreductase [Clostridia bacterium]
MYDIIIIGAGPAGISAGLYTKRAGMNVLILYYGESNLEKATKIDNYYGFAEGISGKDLYQEGIKQAENIGIEVKNEEVITIQKTDKNFTIKTVNGEYLSKTAIISTGNKKLRPNIKGITEFEGKGISYCAICDGFFYRNKNVAVIGAGKFALSEAEHLKKIASNVIILTNGNLLENNKEYETITKKIKEVHGESKVKQIEFEDNSKIDIDGIFIAIGEAGGSDFAKKMGVMLQNDNIVVDENMQTNIEGLYSCGNATGGLLQVCKAVYEGAKAGLSATAYAKKI